MGTDENKERQEVDWAQELPIISDFGPANQEENPLRNQTITKV